MTAELRSNYQEIMGSVCAEDLFGPALGDSVAARLENLQRAFDRLSKVVDPERYIGDLDDKELATEALERLSQFFERARAKVREGTYGRRTEERLYRGKGVVVEAGKRKYLLGNTLAEGDLSTVYSGECIDGDDFAAQVVVKIVADPDDNDLALNEVRILRLLQSKPAAQSKHLPVLLDHFRTTEDQVGVVLRQLDGYDLLTVRESPRWKTGLDQKHVLWMLNRLLSVVGYVHSVGVIHGNIEPSHLLIRPGDHNLWLVDWSYAVFDPVHTRDSFKVFNEDFSAPEIEDGASPHPACDLYSVGKTMIWLLGGDVRTNTIPEGVDDWLQHFIRQFVFESPRGRPQDAWQMHEKMVRLRDRYWGQQFLEFRL